MGNTIMHYYISKPTLVKKSLAIFLISLSLGFLALMSNEKLNLLKSIKPYYIKAYTAALLYRLNDQGNIIKNHDRAISVPVIAFHGIVDKPDGFNTTLDVFKNELFALKKAGYQTVKLSDYYKFVNNEIDLPDKSILLTYDDGRKDSVYASDPILSALGYNAVNFDIVGATDKNVAHLTTQEMRDFEKTGRWDFESHTFAGHGLITISSTGEQGHFLSNKLWLADQNRLETDDEFRNRISTDILLAKTTLEKKLNKSVIGFAYPYNDYGQEPTNYPQAKSVVMDTVKKIYSLSFYQVGSSDGSTFNYPGKDNFMVKRIEITPDYNGEKLVARLESSKAKLFPFTDTFSNNYLWIMTRERMRIKEHLMDLGAYNSTGSTAFLDGTEWWKNYTFTALVDWLKGSNVFLLARFQDDSNYTSCNFSKERTRIEQRINGQNMIITEVKNNILGLNQGIFKLGISVNDKEVSCLYNGNVLASAETSENVTGGIGFKTWDRTMNNSEILVTKIQVDENR